MKIKFRPHIASNTNNTCQIVAHMQQHKRTACSCRANPTPACNKRRSMRSRHRHCNVFAQRMMVRLLRPHTESSTHNARRPIQATQTHTLFVQGQHDTVRYIQQTNINAEPSWCIWTAHESEITISYCIKHQLITPPNSSNMNKRTYCLLHSYWHWMKMNAEPPSPSWCVWTAHEGEMHYDLILHRTPITTSNLSTHTQQCKRTRCSSSANATPFHTFNQRRSTQSRNRHYDVMYLDNAWGWDYDLVAYWIKRR